VVNETLVLPFAPPPALAFCVIALALHAAVAQPVRLHVDFAKPDGEWSMPALALGQGGLQSDPMIEPHVKAEASRGKCWPVGRYAEVAAALVRHLPVPPLRGGRN